MFDPGRAFGICLTAIAAIVLGCTDPDSSDANAASAGAPNDATDTADAADGAGLSSGPDTIGNTDTIGETQKCNGHTTLCAKRVDEVVFLRTHNSHAAYTKGYAKVSANHQYAIPKQLADGVRALNVDVYKEDGKLLLCHGYCALGNEPFGDAMAEIKAFLDANANEVLLMGLQNETSRAVVIEAFKKSGLAAFAHTQAKGKPWPTLAEMIASGKRLVLFAGGGGGAAWLHTTGHFIYGTNWGTKTKDDFTCKLNQAAFKHGLFELDHTLTNPWAKIEFGDANMYAFLLQRANKCAKIVGKTPNMISVDWYAVGDALKVVDELNGVGG